MSAEKPNYITPEGLARLRAEYDELHRVERPRVVEVVSWAASNGDRSENGDYLYGKKRLREIDRRMRFLARRMKAARVINPDEQPRKDKVFFGARVTYVDEEDRSATVTLVGEDEFDASAGRISWTSPVARALLKAGVGDVVTVHTPAGPREIEITDIEYE